MGDVLEKDDLPEALSELDRRFFLLQVSFFSMEWFVSGHVHLHLRRPWSAHLTYESLTLRVLISTRYKPGSLVQAIIVFYVFNNACSNKFTVQDLIWEFKVLAGGGVEISEEDAR